MTDSLKDQEQLEQAIAAIENQREILGDTVVDAALVSMREKLSSMVASQSPKQQRKLATVLFMDIVGSTSITRDLDPEDSMTIMDSALQHMAKPVYSHGGRVTRFMGDGFLALFGAPVARENEPEMAVRAGLQIIDEAQKYARELQEKWHIASFDVRLGISTGLIMIGGDSEAENTIMGSTVNLAARLENAAKPGTLLISQHTYQHICDLFDVRNLEPINLKGFADPIQVYQVVCSKPIDSSESNWDVAGIQTSMIGRDPELLMLQDIFIDATEDAKVHVVTVIGEAGIGKSRLLYEYEKWIECLPQEINYINVRATLETETSPYGLIRRLFAIHFEILESDSTAVVMKKFRTGMSVILNSNQADLVGHLLGFDFSSSQAVQSQLGSGTFSDQATVHLTRYLEYIFNIPTLILLEDIHWADDSSLDLIDHLVNTLEKARLMVICLARPSIFERRPNWGEGLECHTRITLKPLSRRASRALVHEIFKKVDSIPTNLRDLIVDAAEGNPFYVEELIKMLIDDGLILVGENQWKVKLISLPKARVPLTLTGILQARLDSLPYEEKAVLQRASVVGRQFWGAVVAELIRDDVGSTQIDELLNNVRKRELIFRKEFSIFETTDEYIFKHALLRDVAYETVLLKLRHKYHAQVAQWLESTAGERISEYLSLIARHYELAGQNAKAVDYLLRSGEESIQISAFRDAVSTFERVLSLLSELEPAQGKPIASSSAEDYAKKAQVLINLGNAYNRLGDYQKALQTIERGLALARIADDSQAIIAALNRLAQMASEQGNFDIAQQYLDEVLLLARQQDDLPCVASTLSMLGSITWKWGNLEQAETFCNESLVIYEQLNEPEKIPRLLNILGILATLQENYVQAEEYYQQGLMMAKEIQIDDPLIVTNFLNNLGYLNHHSTQNFEEAKQYYENALQIAREINHRSGVTSTLNNLGQLHILLGNYKDAIGYLREALSESVAIGAVPLSLDALVGIAQYQVAIEDYRTAAEILGLVLNHSALELDVRQVAEAVLDKLQNQIPSDQLENSMNHGKMQELESVISGILDKSIN
jgi:predicted ATPase/class 3 adenylate cyclase